MISKKIAELRNILKQYKIDGYIVPSNDEYMNEYVPERNRRLEFISGFTGSNGILVIDQNHAFFFTDGRYIEQAKKQLPNNIFSVVDLNQLADFNWPDGNSFVFGYDPKLFTKKSLQTFSKLELTTIEDNLIDKFWLDKPKERKPEIYSYLLEYSGEAYQEKINKCRNIIEAKKADALVITAVDSICWALNLRSSDVPNAPLMLSKLIITTTKIYLFINDKKRITKQVASEIAEVDISEFKNFSEILANLGKKILLDKDAVSIHILNLCAMQGKEVIHLADPCQLPKACKNSIEIAGAINSHIKDAVAVCEFFAQLEDNIKKGVTEYELAEILVSCRQKQSGYVMDSFPVICGYNENSAIIHYQAQKDSAKIIEDRGILLIDSGGQYLGGTTDVTRTIIIGDATKEQKTHYTQVLKGHIALASVVFPDSIMGLNLDVLARQYLWQDGLDYPHGTGHGVGNFLSVHEGPQNINLRNTVKLAEGMIVSNEPGYYIPGKYGIRIENLQYVKKAIQPNFLCFENLTLIPYAKELIDMNLLTLIEKKYLKNYYNKINDAIANLLSSRAASWMHNQLKLINF